MNCMSLMMIPAGLVGSQTPVSTPGGDYSVFCDNENCWALQIAPEGFFTTIALGPGFYIGDIGHLHPYFPGLVPLSSPDGTRLIDLTQGGAPEEVILPQKPCAKGHSCGRAASLDAAIPMGDDRFLDFYSVDSFRYPSYGSHARLYVSVDKATRKPLGDYAPWPDNGAPLPAYPQAMPASLLQRQCIAAEKCLADTPVLPRWRDCLGDWTGPSNMGSPALDWFLSIPPDFCYALISAYPHRSLLQTTPCEVGCRGDALIAECANYSGTPDTSVMTVTRVIDCTLYGSRCQMPEGGGAPFCTDGTPNPIPGTCTENGGAALYEAGNFLVVRNCSELRGQGCYLNPVDSQSPICAYPPCEPPSGCDGDVTRNCVSGQANMSTDCSLRDLDCTYDGVYTQCVTPQVSEPDLPADICEGDYLIFKGGQRGEVRFVDCSELGGTCDDSNPERPVCR